MSGVVIQAQWWPRVLTERKEIVTRVFKKMICHYHPEWQVLSYIRLKAEGLLDYKNKSRQHTALWFITECLPVATGNQRQRNMWPSPCLKTWIWRMQFLKNFFTISHHFKLYNIILSLIWIGKQFIKKLGKLVYELVMKAIIYYSPNVRNDLI